MSGHIPYGRQDISEEDIQAVTRVLRSDWLTQGPAIEEFEKELARHCQAPHAVAVANATAALHLGALALGMGPGKRLWTSPNSFLASANCGLYCGGEVDFVDIDPDTFNMDPRALEDKLHDARNQGKLPQVVVPVDFAGQSCDMRRIWALAQEYGFKVMADASHAVGGTYLGKPIGCSEFADLTVFSFHPVKIVTTAEGGALLARDAKLDAHLRRLRSHGMTRDPQLMDQTSEGAWYYQQIELGYNYRITDIQAVLGTSQLKRLAQFVERRNILAVRYHELLKDLPLRLPRVAKHAVSAWHLYVVRIDEARSGKTRRQVFDLMRAQDIGVNVHYIPIHTQPYYRALGFKLGDFPQAEKYYSEALSLPMYSSLTESNQDRVVATLRKALTK